MLTGFGRGLRITQRIARRLPVGARRARARRQRPRAPRGAGRRARAPLGAPGRAPARDRLRARRRARRALPDRAGRVRRGGLPHERLLAEGAGRGAAGPLWSAAAAAARSSAWTSTRASPGRPTTGRACRRPRWSRSTATWPATSARAACAPTSSPPGPLQTVAARNIEGFGGLAEAWERQAPLGWDLSDPGPVADACLFLLSPLSRMVTGEILHVDGGYHALGAPPAGAAALEVGRRGHGRGHVGRPRVHRAPPQLGQHAHAVAGVAAADDQLARRCGSPPWPAAPARRCAARCRPGRCRGAGRARCAPARARRSARCRAPTPAAGARRACPRAPRPGTGPGRGG